jgi:hypothetical protein
MTLQPALTGPDPARRLLQVFLHFMLLSLLAIGGAITTAPDMQRFIVGERGWLTTRSSPRRWRWPRPRRGRT